MNRKTCYVKDFMSAAVVTLTPDMDIMEAVHLLVEKGISGAPVMDQHGNLVGMLTEHDCIKVALNAGYYGDLGGLVSEFMHPHVETIDVGASILDVAEKFISKEYRRFPVVNENRLAGQISRHDVLKALMTLASGKY